MKRYRVTFDRIGRDHNVPDLHVDGTEDDLLDEVMTYCSRFLTSSGFDIDINLGTGEGWVEMGRFGTFTVKELDGAS
jgi:hypothetical protein